MSHKLFATSVVLLVLVGWRAVPARAGDRNVARGTIVSIAGDAVTVKVMDREMTFGVDAATHVEAVGAGTKMAKAQAAGRAGLKLNEVLRDGQPVEVAYHDESGALRATRIRAVASAAEPSDTERADGVVKFVSPSSMTINGSNGKAIFTQTFTIDPNTRVIGKGAGTLAASKGGRASITDLVAAGDSVSVAYRKVGSDALHASEIRLLAKPHAFSSSSSK